MSNAQLTKELGLSLMTRLAEDDGFRARFEAAPASALVEIGVSAEVVVNLKSSCLERRTLASKETFRKLLREDALEASECAMKMVVPQIGFAKRSTNAKTQVVAPAFATEQVPSPERMAVH